MGRTYKEQPDDDYFDDELTDFDVDDEFELDDDMEELAFSQYARKLSGKRSKQRKSERHASDFSRSSALHKLPADWMDFDYTTSAGRDDWH